MTRTVVAGAIIVAAVATTFHAVAGFAFLNWDDHAVIVQNPSLSLPGVVQWAFTTTHMEHYQPLSWLLWAAIKSAFGLDPTAFHLANLVAHVLCALLVWFAGRKLLPHAVPHLSEEARDAAAVVAALLFALHPLRVEVVAWISALPYALALALMIAALLAYLRAAGHQARRWWVAAFTLYAASLLARPVALGFPIVLFVLDMWLFKRPRRARLASVLPFALLSIAATVLESIARAPALDETPWLYRVQSASAAPFVYLRQTLAPVTVTRLDTLPLDPAARPEIVIGATLALTALSVAAWRWRHRWPAFGATWICYLALLAPAAGLLPSGLQIAADRYAYVPGVIVAIAIAGVCARWAVGRPSRARFVAVTVVVVSLACAAMAQRALAPWSDSITFWTHVVSLKPTDDIGLYNLAAALASEGRSDEAAGRYRELLALQPAHAPARANLNRLDAARLEREGNALAASGDLIAAAERYRQALARDAHRTHSHAARGMALATLGQTTEAIPSLREAVRQGVKEPEVHNALGVLLLQSGDVREAREVFEAALATYKSDVNLAHNLARLLSTHADTSEGDAALALTLARAVVDATGGRDPRALDTMAAALATSGRTSEAVAMSARAAALAKAQGDSDLAVQITARGREYRRPGR